MVTLDNKTAVIYINNNNIKTALNKVNIDFKEAIDFNDFLQLIDGSSNNYYIISKKHILSSNNYSLLIDKTKQENTQSRTFIIKDSIEDLTTGELLLISNSKIKIINIETSTEKEYEDVFLRQIQNQHVKDNKGNIISFTGMNSSVGTTMIAQSVAESIAKNNKDIEALMLYIDEFDSTDYNKDISEKEAKIDMNIKNKAETDILGKSDISKETKKVKNLNILRVAKLFDNKFEEDYTIYKKILELLTDMYDILIIDATNLKNIGNPFVLAALTKAKLNFLITDNRNNVKYLDYALDITKHFNIKDFTLITNKSTFEDFAFKDYDELIKLNLTVKEVIGKDSETTFDQKTLYEYKDKYFTESMNNIIKQISIALNYDFKTDNTKLSLINKFIQIK